MTHDDNRLNDVAAMQILGPRERQEDSALHVRLGRGRLIVVADGMGGEPAGHIASMAAVLGFEKGFGAPGEQLDGFQNNLTWAGRFMDGLAGALDAMNAAVEEGRGSYGMATTLLEGPWTLDTYEGTPESREQARMWKDMYRRGNPQRGGGRRALRRGGEGQHHRDRDPDLRGVDAQIWPVRGLRAGDVRAGPGGLGSGAAGRGGSLNRGIGRRPARAHGIAGEGRPGRLKWIPPWSDKSQPTGPTVQRMCGIRTTAATIRKRGWI